MLDDKSTDGFMSQEAETDFERLVVKLLDILKYVTEKFMRATVKDGEDGEDGINPLDAFDVLRTAAFSFVDRTMDAELRFIGEYLKPGELQNYFSDAKRILNAYLDNLETKWEKKSAH